MFAAVRTKWFLLIALADMSAYAQNIVVGNVNASLDYGSPAGGTFQGVLSYEADQVADEADRYVQLNSLDFTLLGVPFTNKDIFQGGQARFLDGVLQNVTASFPRILRPGAPANNITLGIGDPDVIGHTGLDNQFGNGSFEFLFASKSGPASKRFSMPLQRRSRLPVAPRNVSGASLNIQQFGGKGDGVSDDAPAFRAAFAALTNTGGGTLTVPDTGKPYLVGSWDPTPRDGLLFVALIPPNVTLTGTGVIKMKDNAYPTPTDGSGGVYYGLNLFGAFGSSNITVSNLAFDMNGQNNLQPAGLPHIMNTFRFYGASNVTVQNVTIKNSPGHNMVVFEQATGVGAIVKDSTFSVGGRGIPGNTLNSDFSFLYSEWSHTQFLNNTIHQDSSNDHASGGIEIHGSHSVAKGNRIENCNPAFWLASTPIAVDDVVLSNNNIINANRGIAFWSGDNSSLSNIQLINNSINIHYNPVFTQLYGLGDDAAGIITPYLYAAYTGRYVSGTAAGSVIRNLTITGNTIFSSDGPLAVNTQAGIVIQGVQNALIAGNTVSNMGSNGIVVLGSPWGDNNIVVDRNNLQNIGLNKTQVGHEGILVDTRGSSLVPMKSVFDGANIIMFGNTMTQTGTGIQTVGYSLNWEQGHMRNLVVGSNGLSVVVGGPQVADNAMMTRDPVETVGSLNGPSPCVTGDINWQVARDVMSGWLCDAGTWMVFGQ